MSPLSKTAAALLAASLWALPGTSSAAPLAGALALKNAAPAVVETVQWRRGWGGAGVGVGAGLIAGAVIGSALAAPYYYAPPPPVVYAPAPVYGAPVYGPPAYGPPGYGPPGPAYGAPVAGDAVAYCTQRFRSYDPASGTYLGYDGLRHPCP